MKSVMNLFRRGSKSETVALRTEVESLRLENAVLRREQEALRERFHRLEADQKLVLEALERLEVGLPPASLGALLLELTARPFGLASFYLALMDWDLDGLSFPYYYEGGRPRNHPGRKLSVAPGLTGRVLLEGRSLYTRTLEEAEALGAILTEAEKGSGLIPASWYGVPLGRSPRPWGVVAFMSFQRDAFPEDRRALLDALVRVLELALRR